MRQPTVVFCTTCKGRLDHLRQTLPQNIQDNSDYPNAKFVVLSYGDNSETADFIATLKEPLATGRLVFYHFSTNEPFHVSHAKNMAARCGIMEGADILVTLDADNFATPGMARWIAEKFQTAEGHNPPRLFLCPDFPGIQAMPWSPARPARGFAGRLAIRAQDFVKAGGYDETFDTWRGEDIDLIARLKRMGYSMQHIDLRFLRVIPHNAFVRFKEYPHAQELYENKRQVKIIDARTETVVNFGKFGVGAVTRNSCVIPIELKPAPTRIFGIGMHKTGTTSLDAAFKLLGLDSFHWGTGEAPIIWREVNNAGRSKMVELWYALSDLPIPLLFKKLDAAYPGSKFILTKRDPGKWLESVERLWNPLFNATRWVWDRYPFTNRIHTALYGRADFEPVTFLKRYNRHNQEVLEYFKDRPGDLLVMDMGSANSWQGLCEFLNVEEPAEPYPVKNPTVSRAPAVTHGPQVTNESLSQNVDNLWRNPPLITDTIDRSTALTPVANVPLLDPPSLQEAAAEFDSWVSSEPTYPGDPDPPPPIITRKMRRRRRHHHHKKNLCTGLIVWFTGLSGAGKTTLGEAVRARLLEMGYRVALLDGDVVRQILCRDLGFERHHREENIRRLAYVARLLAEQGVIVLVSAISPYRATRDEVRAQLSNFIEVYVNAPLEVCEARDVKGLYAKARQGDLELFTGVGQCYEPPTCPEIECRTDCESIEQCVQKILDYLMHRIGQGRCKLIASVNQLQNGAGI